MLFKTWSCSSSTIINPSLSKGKNKDDLAHYNWILSFLESFSFTAFQISTLSLLFILE